MNNQIQLKVKNENANPLPCFPVGSIYLSIIDTNPTIWFGGTWEQIAKGRTLVGVDANDTDFNTVKKTGGEKKHILSISEMPIHNHIPNIAANAGAGGLSAGYGIDYYSGQRYPVKDANNATGGEFTGWGIQNSGGGQAHNNLQPYFTCYIWCRIS